MFEKILKMFYPSRCIFCDRLLEYDTKLEVCDKCYSVLPFVEKQDGQTKYCDQVFSVFNYDDKIKDIIQKFKYHHMAYLYKTFSRLMIRHVGSKITGDVIVSVPIYKDREAIRGYNQAHLLAKEVSKITRIQYDKNVLVRNKNTGALALCNSKEREQRIREAFFVVDAKVVNGKNVIIVDDVFTTGATINECSRVLKESGAKKVIAIVIAKTTLGLQGNAACVDI